MWKWKKQRRGVDRADPEDRSRAGKVFDQAGIDCLEVEMGMLVRRKRETGYEWIIEI